MRKEISAGPMGIRSLENITEKSIHFFVNNGFSVLRNSNLHRAVAAVYTLVFVTIPVISIVRALGLFIAYMIFHPSFYHFFDHTPQRSFEASWLLYSYIS